MSELGDTLMNNINYGPRQYCAQWRRKNLDLPLFTREESLPEPVGIARSEQKFQARDEPPFYNMVMLFQFRTILIILAIVFILGYFIGRTITHAMMMDKFMAHMSKSMQISK